MMDQVIHHHGAQHCNARHRENFLAPETKAPDLK
jgi:hypothetical protein